MRAIVLQRDGKILVGGEFSAYNNVKRNYIARLNADGTLDNTFAPALGPDYYVSVLAIQEDGKILVGGQFVSVDNYTRDHLARLENTVSKGKVRQLLQ